MLSEKTRECLLKAGWTEDRRVDITEWVASLRRIGISPSPKAQEFMSQYAGLDIRIPAYNPTTGHWEKDLQIELIDASKGTWPEEIQRIYDHSGVLMFPIGWHHGLYEIIFMAPDGSVFGYDEGELGRFSYPNEEGINAVVEGAFPHETYTPGSGKRRWVPWEQTMKEYEAFYRNNVSDSEQTTFSTETENQTS
jgi:hypothetical protein